VTTTTPSPSRADGATAAVSAPSDAAAATGVHRDAHERGAPAEAAQLPTRYRYRIRFSICGRIRFLSHLETVDVLLSAFRRAGITVALSEGFRPKPRIRMAMPRPVGVEAWNEIMEVELGAPVDPDEFAFRLQPTLPAGVILHGVDAICEQEANATRRVRGAIFRLEFSTSGNGSHHADGAQLHASVARVRTAAELPIDRSTPKQRKTINVRAFVDDISFEQLEDGRSIVRYIAQLTAEGSVRPDEVVRALESQGATQLPVPHVIRERIIIANGTDGVVAVPELVGADVPDGPEKPWGAC
jgi:radical SAM-linked protein